MLDRLGNEVDFTELFMEETLSAKDRKELPDSMYGIVYTDENGKKVRKYPLNDEKHVLQAVRFFNKAPEEHKPELARKIVKRAKELNMDYSGWEVLKPYLNGGKKKVVKESFMTYEWLMKQNYPDPDSTSGTSDFDESSTSSEDDVFNETFGEVMEKNLQDRMIKSNDLLPVRKPNSDEVYFASDVNYMPEIDLDRPLFVTPYKDLASIFAGRNALRSRLRGLNYNLEYEEWLNFDERKDHNPLKEVHVYVEGVPDLDPFVIEAEGYIHCILTRDYEDNFFRYHWMNDLEYLIAKTDNMKVQFFRQIKCKVKYIVEGRPWKVDAGKTLGRPDRLPSRLQIAKNIAKDIHEYVEKKSKEPTGNQNCLLCTWCAEAQFRGRTVLPRPVYSPRDMIFKYTNVECVKGGEKKRPRGFDNLMELLQDAGDGDHRWYCHVDWNEGNGGHEFLILKIDGKYHVMDAQQGEVGPLTSAHKYFDDVAWKGTFIVRLNNKPFDFDLLKQVNDPANTLPWDPDKDIPYMVKHGMITKEEAKKELKHAETMEFYKELKKELGQTPVQESALPDGVFLRPATLKDVPTMRDWQLKSINARLRKRPDMFEYMEKDARESVPDTKMIMSGDRTIGMLQCCWIDDGEWWYIGEIYLIAEFRGRGIGSTLLLNEISEHDKLRLQVATDNPRAKALYESLGFKTVRMNQDMEVMDLVKTPESICENIVEQLKSFKYGLGYDGSIHSASSKEYDEKYRLESPEEFEENGGGICYDYVEFMDQYLKEYGYHCRKFYISTETEDNDTHTFILVNDGKGGYVYPESAFKLLEGVHHVKSPEDAALKVMDKVFDINDNGKKYDEIKYYVWEYQGHPSYGSTMEECGKYFSKGEPFHEGTAKKIK